MSATEVMVYVACDPATPDDAWGIVADDPHPSWRPELAKTLADWIKRGGIVMRVDRKTGCDMLQRGLADRVHPKQGELL